MTHGIFEHSGADERHINRPVTSRDCHNAEIVCVGGYSLHVLEIRLHVRLASDPSRLLRVHLVPFPRPRRHTCTPYSGRTEQRFVTASVTPFDRYVSRSRCLSRPSSNNPHQPSRRAQLTRWTTIGTHQRYIRGHRHLERPCSFHRNGSLCFTADARSNVGRTGQYWPGPESARSACALARAPRCIPRRAQIHRGTRHARPAHSSAVQLTVATVDNSAYSQAISIMLCKRSGATDEDVAALISGTVVGDEKLSALLTVAHEAAAHGGWRRRHDLVRRPRCRLDRHRTDRDLRVRHADGRRRLVRSLPRTELDVPTQPIPTAA